MDWLRSGYSHATTHYGTVQILMLNYANQRLHDLPVQVSPLGSGSHTPFSVQVAESGPMSVILEGQLKVMIVPSTGIRLGTESLPSVDNNCNS